jgi:hypothetical protein
MLKRLALLSLAFVPALPAAAASGDAWAECRGSGTSLS